MRRQTGHTSRLRLNRPLLIFAVLVVYIFASFVWWSYLLIRNNRQTLLQARQLLELQYHVQGITVTDIGQTPEYLQLEKQYRRQVLMVMGEGVVFLILLGLAVLQIWRSYRHEITLARQQRNFMLSITHELKSPLASIKLGLETIIKRVLEPETRDRLLGNAMSDTNRLQSLVEDILLAARMEDRSFQFARDHINLSGLVEQVCRKVEQSRPDHNYRFDIESGLTLPGDRQALTALVANLLDNAVKYSEAGTTVSLRLYHEGQHIHLEVADTGIGIPEGERSLIFRKFYRVGNEDTRSTKGTGLGLFIVKEAADGHQAKMQIDNNRPTGTIFRIRFPAPAIS